MSDRQLELLIEYWHSTSTESGREALLFSAGHVNLLRGLWQHSLKRPEWLSADAISGFHLVEVLSRTSVSLVCVALRSDGLVCCIKIPYWDGNLLADQQIRRRGLVRHESEVLRWLSKSGVRSVGNLSEWVSDGVIVTEECGELPWLATRYQRGLRPLAVAMRDLDGSERLRVLVALSDLVGELHDVGLVHGDLHGGNVFVRGEELSPVVLDFGLARVVCGGVSGGPGERELVRQFCPGIPLWAHERRYSGLPITAAMDVLCLGLLARGFLEDCFDVNVEAEAEGAGENRVDGLGLRSGHGKVYQSARLRRLLEESSWPEPEYRPQSAGAFAAGLRGIVGGPAIRSRRTRWLEIGVWLRRHGILAGVGAIALFAVTGFLWQRQSVELERAIKAAELSQERAEAERRRLEVERTWESAYSLALTGASLAVGADPSSVGGVDSLEFRELRADVGRRLVELLSSEQRGLAVPDEALELLERVVALVSAMVDRGGYAAGLRLAEASVPAAVGVVKRMSGKDRLRASLLSAELRGLASACSAQLEIRAEAGGGAVGGDFSSAARSLAEAAIEDFLGQSVEEIRRFGLAARSLRVAFVLADRALYPQRGAAWVAEAKRDYVGEVFGRALECAGVEDLKESRTSDAVTEERFWLAAVLTTRGLHGHKRSWRRGLSDQEERSAEVRGDLNRAAEILDGLLAMELAGGLDQDDVELMRGRVDSLRSMSFLNGSPRDVGMAMEYGELALRRRRRAAERDPGSLRKRREVIASGWNLCDALTSAADEAGEEDHRRMLLQRAREVRGEMVERAKSVLQEDRSVHSLTDYGVNSTRLIFLQLLLGEDRAAEAQLGELRAMAGIGAEWWESDSGIAMLVPLADVCFREGTGAADEELAMVIRQIMLQPATEDWRKSVGKRLESLKSGREQLWEKLGGRADWRELERWLFIAGE